MKQRFWYNTEQRSQPTFILDMCFLIHNYFVPQENQQRNDIG